MTNENTVRTVLVDDHQLVLEGLSRVLAREGMTVAGCFGDIPSTLSFLACHDIDFLVADLRLGTESGISLVGEVRRRHPAVRIAILSCFDDTDSACAALHAGATGYLLKDTSTPELARQLHDISAGHLVVDSRVAAAVLNPQRLLAAQELHVLELVAEGLTNREIGKRLFLSHYTVKDYLCRVMRKLGTSTRAETVAKAVHSGLLRPTNPV